MRNLLFIFAFLLFASFNSNAQIGISGAYSSISTPGWEEILSNEGATQYENGYTISLDYWTRLKNYRVEFLPELSYSRYDNIIDGPTIAPQPLESNLNIFALSLNTQIYLFDIEGDCDCPTWGKEGGFFNKGFYFMVGPGVSFVSHSDDINLNTDPPTIEIFGGHDAATIRFMASAGAGFDIGITKDITLTLFGKFKWHAPNFWPGLRDLTLISPDLMEYDDFESAITQFEPGLKIHYRWGE